MQWWWQCASTHSTPLDYCRFSPSVFRLHAACDTPLRQHKISFSFEIVWKKKKKINNRNKRNEKRGDIQNLLCRRYSSFHSILLLFFLYRYYGPCERRPWYAKTQTTAYKFFHRTRAKRTMGPRWRGIELDASTKQMVLDEIARKKNKWFARW